MIRTASVAPATTVAPAAVPTLAATATAARGPGAVAFLRAQEPACARHAAATGNPVVEPDRFTGDVMPPPYGFGCSEKAFVGAADA